MMTSGHQPVPVVLDDGRTRWTRDEVNHRAERVRRVIDAIDPTSTALVVVDGSVQAAAAVVGAIRSARRVALIEDAVLGSEGHANALSRLSPQLVIAPSTDHPVGDHRLALDDIPDVAPSAVPMGDPIQDEVLQFTSGSTGEPKFARQTRQGIRFGCDAYRDLFELTPADRTVIPVPVVHSYGLAALVSSVDAGAAVRLASMNSPAELLHDVAEHTTVLFGTPLLLRLVSRMWGQRTQPQALRLVLSAGGPVPEDVSVALQATLGVPVRQIYGTTEVGLIACVSARCNRWPQESAGRVVAGVSTSVADDGALLVRSPALFRGYLGDEHVPAGGNWSTGDTATIDARGFLTVGERSRSVVKVGGRRVSTRAVTDVVIQCPGVEEAQVVARRGSDGDDELIAVVVAEEAVSLRDIAAACRRGGLGAHEVPRHVLHLPELPRTGIHKVALRHLEEIAAERVTTGPLLPTNDDRGAGTTSRSTVQDQDAHGTSGDSHAQRY